MGETRNRARLRKVIEAKGCIDIKAPGRTDHIPGYSTDDALDFIENFLESVPPSEREA